LFDKACVEASRRRDDHCFDGGVAKRGRNISGCLFDAELIGKSFGYAGQWICDGDEVGVDQPSSDALGMERANPTCSD
jgi:hypothetical protein